MGPAPTRLPRMALPLPTDHPLLNTLTRTERANGPLVIEQQIQAHNAEEPEDPGEDGEPVQIPLHDGR